MYNLGIYMEILYERIYDRKYNSDQYFIIVKGNFIQKIGDELNLRV